MATNHPEPVDFEALRETTFGTRQGVQPQPRRSGSLEALRADAAAAKASARKGTLDLLEEEITGYLRDGGMP